LQTSRRRRSCEATGDTRTKSNNDKYDDGSGGDGDEHSPRCAAAHDMGIQERGRRALTTMITTSRPRIGPTDAGLHIGSQSDEIEIRERKREREK
jgi:hypothetical protein